MVCGSIQDGAKNVQDATEAAAEIAEPEEPEEVDNSLSITEYLAQQK